MFEGWGVGVVNPTKTSYGAMLSVINKKTVTNVVATYVGTSIKTVTPVSTNAKSMAGAFYQCSELTTAPTIPSKVNEMTYSFQLCKSLSGTITINANPTAYSSCFSHTEKSIVLTGSSSKLSILANTATKR